MWKGSTSSFQFLLSLLSLDCVPRPPFTHEYHEPDPSDSLAFASWNCVGLEGGVANSSKGCSSSNFVNVTMTRIVGTIGIAIWNKMLQEVRYHNAKIDIKAWSVYRPWTFSSVTIRRKYHSESPRRKISCKKSYSWEHHGIYSVNIARSCNPSIVPSTVSRILNCHFTYQNKVRVCQIKNGPIDLVACSESYHETERPKTVQEGQVGYITWLVVFTPKC